MLDVLDPDAVRAPEEDRERVRRVDEAVDLDPRVLRVLLVLVGRVDEDGEMVQQRPLGRAGVALVELDEGAADLDAGDAVLRRRFAEPVRQILARRLLRIACEQVWAPKSISPEAAISRTSRAPSIL